MIRYVLVSVLLATTLTRAASAQDTATLIEPRGRPAAIPNAAAMSVEDRSRATLVRYASCLVARSRASAEKVAFLPVDDPSYASRAERLSVSDCLSASELSFDRMLLRGYIFAALYKKDFGSVAPGQNATAIDFFAGLDNNSPRDAVVQAQMLTLADCVVRKDPVVSRMFILAPVASASEQAALNKLVPQLGSCMQQGTQVRFNRTTLYSILAEAAYREGIMARSVNEQSKVK